MGSFAKVLLSIAVLAVCLAIAIAFRSYFGASVVINLLSMSFLC